MTTAAGVERELGWALTTVMKSYLRVAGESLGGVPGGPRGYLVLAAIGRGELGTQVALAQHLGVDRTMMTYLLDDLEEAGLVERRPDPADRRARRVTLTAGGLTRLAELRCSLRLAEESLLGALAEEERTALREMLYRLAEAMAPSNPCELARELEEQTAASVRSRRRRR